MLRLYAIVCLLALATLDANTALAQRGVYRPPPTTRPPVFTLPTLRSPTQTLGGTITLPEQKPVIAVPPPPLEAAPADADFCCPCPGTNECSNACCVR